MSFSIREESPHQVDVSSAILIYGASAPYRSGGSADFATKHPVLTKEGGVIEIGAGEPLDQHGVLELTMQLSGHSCIRHGLLPPNILSIGLNHVAWHVPPTTRTVFFKTTGEGTVGTRSGRTPHPGLVFLAINRCLFLFAVKGGERPDAKTPLYVAPYLNCWESGQVCTGSTPLPDESVIATMKAWEDGFFLSNFSHTNHQRTVRYEGGAHKFWSDMLDGKFRAFPQKVLVLRRKQTVGSLIERIEAGEFEDKNG